jgi:Family of unknown function (DUF5977)
MIKKIFFFTVATCLTGMLKAQPGGWNDAEHGIAIAKNEFKAKRVIQPAPEAAELGKYGNNPISLFTGTPKINIPLCELKGNELSLPVSLSYNAGGFKPNDIATWVGLGWSLNAGGVITRSVMANPDNDNNYFNSSNTYTSIPTLDNMFANYDYIDNVKRGIWETQPDVYYFNFGNHSGKFVLKQNKSVVLKDRSNIKITPDNIGLSGTAASTSSFTIVDESGIKYEFRDVEVSTSITDDAQTGGPPSPLSYTYASSWYLTSITSADGTETIDFTYYNTATAHTLFQDYIHGESQTYSVKTPPGGTLSGTSNSNTPSPLVIVNRKYIQSVNLKKNGTTIGYVNIESATNQRQDLDHFNFPGEQLVQSIKSYARKGKLEYVLLKQYNFSFSYFQSANGKRLRLDNITEVPTNNLTVVKPPYVFEYNTLDIPPYDSKDLDHWGFYNKAGNTTLIPGVDIGGTILPIGARANREPDLAGSSCSILKKIKYPTGGYTTFEYELHDAIANQGLGIYASQPVGGLRIKQMVDYSFENKKAIVKNYEYKQDDGSSSGQSTFPSYISSSKFNYYSEPRFGSVGTDDYITNYTTITASPVGGLGTIQGSHIGYSQVKEYQTDLTANVPLGKTVYKYEIRSIDVNDDDIGNGDLIEQSVYDNGDKLLFNQSNTYNYLGTDGTLAQKVQQHYIQDNKNILCKYTFNGFPTYVWKPSWATNPVCEASRSYTSKLYLQGSHVFKGQYKQLTEQTEKRYDQLSDSYLTSTKKFNYDNPAHTMPTRIEQNSANDEVVVTEKKYTLDYTLPATGTFDGPTNGIKYLQDRNIVGAELESVQYRKYADGISKKYPDGTDRKYINGLFTTYQSNAPYPKNIYKLDLTQPLSTFQFSSTNGALSYNPNYRLLGTFNYDAYGNLQQQAKFQDVKKTYLWGYGNMLPVAEVTDAEIESIAYNSFETVENGNWSTISSIGVNQVAGGITGNYSYNLSGGSITKTGLPTTRQHIVSYWSTSGAISVTSNTGAAAAVSGSARNGWTYYEHLLPQNSNSVTISGSAVIDELRLFPKGAMMITSTYNLYNGLLNSQTSPNNLTSYFDYDGYYRLVNIRDEKRNIVKNFKYNYGLGSEPAPSPQTLFYNQPTQGTFSKTTCPPQGEAVVVYKVPYGKHISSKNQGEADQKALMDVINNGQAYANKYGQCIYYNDVQQSEPVLRNNCYVAETNQFWGPPTPGMGVVYTVPARKYSSTISKDDANAKALADIAANKQANANLNGGCTCTLPYEKWLYYNGTWQCDDARVRGKFFTGGAVFHPTNPPATQWECFYQYVFIDNSVSEVLSEFGPTKCGGAQ